MNTDWEDSMSDSSSTSVTGSREYDYARILLGVVLVAAGLLKGYDLSSRSVAWHGFFFPRGLLIGLVEAELVFGLWLLTGLYPKPTRWIATSCFTVFSAVTLMQALGGETTCGCFGQVSVNPWVTFTFDAAAVFALCRWGPSSTAPPTFRTHPLRTMFFLLSSVLISVLAATMVSQTIVSALTDQRNPFSEDDLVILEPDTWAGKRFPLLNFIDVGNVLSSGHWIVVLYHHDCAACQEVIPSYVRWSQRAIGQRDAPRIALVEMPPYATAGDDLAKDSSPCLVGHLDNQRTWFVRTPVEVVLHDGIVLTSR